VQSAGEGRLLPTTVSSELQGGAGEVDALTPVPECMQPKARLLQ
jgi:hypothetical protein